jgi:histidine triad (HIT) family protein
LLGKLQLAAAAYARELGMAEDGYRTVINCNTHGGQTVYHLHVHLLAGRHMQWPPG